MRGTIGMKKPSSRLRAEIAKLEEQLKAAETREAERIGRIVLKSGFGDIEVDETELQAAFEEVAKRFRGGKGGSNGKDKAGAGNGNNTQTTTVPLGATASNGGEV
jgi:hypothetical protein